MPSRVFPCGRLAAAVCVLSCALLSAHLEATTGPVGETEAGKLAALDFRPREAEHLFNRAGFGVAEAQARRIAQAGLDAAVAGLVTAESPGEDFTDRRAVTRHGIRLPVPGEVDPDGRRLYVDRVRSQYAGPMEEYAHWWIAHMLAADEPLRDRMTLFLHGLFTSSLFDVRNAHEMVEQHQFLRANALGSFKTIVRGMARDVAMLEYLDNDVNVRGHPNENWARELMELFSLGDGNYTEKDIQEAARAFTGWTDENHAFVFDRWQHDDGDKTVLDVRGRLGGDDVIDIIFAQPACADWFASRLLKYFEGVEADDTRRAEYAALLRDEDFEIAPFMRRLLTDPAFYRDEVVGQRIAGPIDYLVGSARRLELAVPETLVLAGGDILGQRLFAPPNVKGWEGGWAWLNTSTIMQRGNLAGVMLGRVDVSKLMQNEDFAEGMGAEGEDKPKSAGFPLGYGAVLRLQKLEWTPAIDITDWLGELGATDDAAVIDALLSELLAVEPPANLRGPLLAEFSAERERAGLGEQDLLDGGAQAEILLRRYAHLVLSLPSAQLN